MENAQIMTQGIMQAVIETMKAAVQVISEAASPTDRNGASIAEGMSARTNGPTLKEATFNWKTQEK